MININPFAKGQRQARRPAGRAAHPAHVEAARANARIPRVRVLPADETMRRLLRHPNGMGFRSEGSVEWPLDKFTQRRLREGSIKIERAIEEKPKAPTQRPIPRRETSV